MKKAIIGSGGFGREIKALLLDNNPNEVIEFFVEDNYVNEISKPLSKLDFGEYEVIVGIGNPSTRKKIVNSLPPKTRYFSVIHKSVIILDNNIKIGEGSVICPNTILTTNIKIGKHAQLNLATTIGHDTTIGDYFTTAPGAKISGNCVIGDQVYVGTNASIREKLEICNNVTIGLNSGVVKSINNPGIYGGVPTKAIKFL
jgi:sugar O-acyltransferase (sialic acid O-acetyltransferase NeuD family)